jgi:hypothetical protein
MGRYTWQLEQLVEEQELQEEAPPIGVDAPSPLLEKEEKEESTRLALLRQRGQDAFWLAWLWGCNNSNLKLHSGQQYSYIGISIPFLSEKPSEMHLGLEEVVYPPMF